MREGILQVISSTIVQMQERTGKAKSCYGFLLQISHLCSARLQWTRSASLAKDASRGLRDTAM